MRALSDLRVILNSAKFGSGSYFTKHRVFTRNPDSELTTVSKLSCIKPSFKNRLQACIRFRFVDYLVTNQCKWIVNTAVDELCASTND